MLDVIVIGAGVHGLSAANYLVDKGKDVLIIEQFPLPHTRGSSHGSSRITRHSYHKTFYADMMQECFEKWKELSYKTDTNLFNNCGIVTLAAHEHCTQIEENLNKSSIEYELLNPEEARQRFPGFSCGEEEFAVFEPSGGVLLADRCLQALQKSVKTGGGIIRDSEKVLKIEQINDEEDGYVRVTTSRSTYTSRKIVLTCGPWVNKMIKPFGVRYPVKVLKINVLYWKAKDSKLYDIKNFPAAIIERGKEHFYSLPIMEYPNHMKVCYHYGVVVDPDEPSKTTKINLVIRNRQYQFVIDCVKKYYPQLEMDPGVQESCIHTNTPDHDLILEYLPGSNKIVIGTGFSNHSFQLAPAVGHILGDLVLDVKPPYSIEPFSSKRFKSLSKV